jgi:hypothetical protein
MYLGALAAPLTVASVIYFTLRGHSGLVHQGVTYTAWMVAINIVILAAFWSGWLLLRRRPSSRAAVLLVLLLFGWLAWCAFPYFGEVI